MRKEYLTILQSIINHYDVYKKIAVSLNWAETETAYCNASQYRHEVYLRFYTVKFEKGYLQSNFAEAFVQTMLTVMGYTEEWEINFWTDMPFEERRYYLEKAPSFYGEYCCYESLHMCPMTFDELKKDVRSWVPWVETEAEMQKQHAEILPDEAHKILSQFSNSEAIWLGGSGYAPDENWLAVQDDAFLFISFHCSG